MDYKAYQHTTVDYMKTQAKISELLRRFEIYDTRWTNLADQVIFEFNKKIELDGQERLAGVRIVIQGINDKNRNQ